MLASLPRPIAHLATQVRAWPTSSQQRARRNAMIAATECAQRRAERDEVAEFFAARFPAPQLSAQHEAVRAQRS